MGLPTRGSAPAAGSTTARWPPRRSRAKDSWWRLANVGPGNRFTEPTVVGVDFPAVALREARWDRRCSTLTVTPVGIAADANERTTFRVTNIGDPARWTVAGPVATDVQLRANGTDLEVDTPVRAEPLFLTELVELA